MRRATGSVLLVLAIACVTVTDAATAASAVHFSAPPGAKLSSARAEASVLTAGGIEDECNDVLLHGKLPDHSGVLELEPTYTKCTAKSLGGLPAKLEWWKCNFVFHPVAGSNKGGETWTAKVDIRCPPPGRFEWNVYETVRAFELGTTICTTRMPPQRTGGTATLHNTRGPKGDISITWNLSRIRYEAVGSTLFCGTPPNVMVDDASYVDSAVIRATDSAGRHVDLSVSE